MTQGSASTKSLVTALAVALLAGVAVAKSAFAAFDLPMIGADRQFTVAPRAGTIYGVARTGVPFAVLVLDDAVRECGLDPAATAAEIGREISRGSRAWSAVAKLHPAPYELLAKNDSLIFLVDSLGAGREHFSSYFVPDFSNRGQSAIVLDCNSVARSYWRPSLAHELVHALAWRLRLKEHLHSWFEEGLAQLAETEAGGYQPLIKTQSLSKSAQVPAFFDDRRPLPNEAYLPSYLFVRYIRDRWGGWKTLRAMFAQPKTSLPDPRFDGTTLEYAPELTKIAAQVLLSEKGRYRSKLLGTTPPVLLRYFALAMTLNSPAVPLYQIPSWPGFSSQPTALDPSSTLKPGQFARVSLDSTGLRPNPLLEAYEVYSWKDERNQSQFRFFPHTAFGSEKWVATTEVPAHARRFLLLINMTDRELPASAQ